MMKCLLLIACLLPFSALAEVVHSPEALPLSGPMVADTSHASIQIHSSFNGAQLLVFGARNSAGDLVVAVRGPKANVTLRRKERIVGMWMHVEQHKYDQLPLFYAVASTKPLKDIASPYLLQQLDLGTEQVTASSNRNVLSSFDVALRETLGATGNWQQPFGKITYFGESLFKARLDLPDTLPRGDYSVEVYLFDQGQLKAFQTIPLVTYKTGMDARIFDEAQNHPWLYGFFAIIMALAFGWLAHRLFHR